MARWRAAEFDGGPVGVVAMAALLTIDSMGDVALANCGCRCEEAMKCVLSRQNIAATEISIFLALQRWVVEEVSESRKAAGARLTSLLNFERMPATFLQNVVSKSGLLSDMTLLHLFRSIAVRSETRSSFQHFLTRAMNCSLEQQRVFRSSSEWKGILYY